MRRSNAVALLLSGLLLGIALPACAQHGGGHGGFSSHSGASHAAPTFRSSPRFAAPVRSGVPAVSQRGYGYRPGPGQTALPRYQPRPEGYSSAQPARFIAPDVRGSAYRPAYRRGSGIGSGSGFRQPYRRPYRQPYYGGIVYESLYGYPESYYPIYPYISPYISDYYGDDSVDAPAQPYSAPESNYGYDPNDGYDPGSGYDPAAPGRIEPGIPYSPYYGSDGPATAPIAARDAAGTPTVTLIFKDRRPNLQIHNYLINGKTLTVWDRQPHEIPINLLNVEATEKINHDAGVDLFLPQPPR